MSLLNSLTTDASIKNETDSVGGSGPVESGLYPLTVALAYVKKSEGGAMGLFLHFKTEDDKEIRQTLWMTSGTLKGCKNYYEKDGQKNYLPGFLHANSLALLTLGKEVSTLTTEEKVVKLYDSNAKAEVPTKVDMIMDLLNQPIIAGIIKQTVDKTAKVEGTNDYVATGETREENEIDKFFRAKDKMTTAEIRAEAAEPEFYIAWDKKWTGKVKNKAKGAVVGQAGTAGAPKAGAAAGGTAKPGKSLFG